MRRPSAGVATIAVATGICALASWALLVGALFFQLRATVDGKELTAGAFVRSTLGVTAIVVGTLTTAATIGLWKGRGWARLIAVALLPVFATISWRSETSGAYIGLPEVSAIVITPLLWWYLFRSPAAEQFEETR